MGGGVVGGAVVVGGGVVGVVPPQGAPLRVQLPGAPEPVATKPKDTDAPGAMLPFQERLVKVYRWPEEVSRASQ
ncbi:hypothetical protein JD81_00892 [Micromonospora sagamiensis]|uniref:Uncharacterized protein n=1 Tax=Micromonospora sagamiensis TaxID=47875 RepID=A0A562WAT9_9ACTN|nr:hypothetical protein JD81_00892 [Micromonospora sagamiensis]